MSKADVYAAFLHTFDIEIVKDEVSYLTRMIVNSGPHLRVAKDFPQCPHERLKIACDVLKEKE